jgi:SpoVK/Ycf46/Vps4 family AAA+-type ATPase
MVGLDDLRQRLQRSVFQPLAREGLYQKITQRVMPHAVNVLPRGVLLYGPPGCGKTWSMRVIAGEAGLPVVVLPCNAVLTKWYGESENRLASVFAQCREANRMILLIDELDALARHRAESHEATARLVTILLSEMDGIAEATQVLLVGSVNNVDAIDPAVRDRFDLKMEFRLPDREQLRAALAYYARQLTSDDIDELVEQMSGWNFRKIARFAEEVVRTYVSTLDLSRLEAADPPVPLKEDYLAALDGFR